MNIPREWLLRDIRGMRSNLIIAIEQPVNLAFESGSVLPIEQTMQLLRQDPKGSESE